MLKSPWDGGTAQELGSKASALVPPWINPPLPAQFRVVHSPSASVLLVNKTETSDASSLLSKASPALTQSYVTQSIGRKPQVEKIGHVGAVSHLAVQNEYQDTPKPRIIPGALKVASKTLHRYFLYLSFALLKPLWCTTENFFPDKL